MTTRRIVPTLAAALIALLVAPALPAAASVTGSMHATCRTHFPIYPGTGTAYCNSIVTPNAQANYAGLDDNGAPYFLTGPGDFTATFSYSAFCTTSAPPLTWTASGSFAVTGLTGTHSAATASASFQLTVIGSEGVLISAPTTIVWAGGSATSAGGDEGTVQFVPIVNARKCMSRSQSDERHDGVGRQRGDVTGLA